MIRDPSLSGAAPRWSTASFGESSEAMSLEVSALCSHMNMCRPLHARLFSLRCGLHTLHTFVLARFVTTVTVAALLMGAGLSVL